MIWGQQIIAISHWCIIYSCLHPALGVIAGVKMPELASKDADVLLALARLNISDQNMLSCKWPFEVFTSWTVSSPVGLHWIISQVQIGSECNQCGVFKNISVKLDELLRQIILRSPSSGNRHGKHWVPGFPLSNLISGISPGMRLVSEGLFFRGQSCIDFGLDISVK
jgi:hypothetical protein